MHLWWSLCTLYLQRMYYLVEFMYLVFTEDVPLVEFMYLVFTEDVPLVEFVYLLLTRTPGESYRRRFRSLL